MVLTVRLRCSTAAPSPALCVPSTVPEDTKVGGVFPTAPCGAQMENADQPWGFLPSGSPGPVVSVEPLRAGSPHSLRQAAGVGFPLLLALRARLS